MVKTTSYTKKAKGMWNIRTLVLLIGILFLGIQLAFLALNIFLYVEDPKAHVGTFLDWFHDHGVRVPFCGENILISPIVSPASSNQVTPATSSIEAKDQSSFDPSSASATSSNRNNDNRACIIRVSTVSIHGLNT